MTDPLKPADSDLRAAPYPPETSAKGWRFEIAMEKVRQSDTWSLTLLRGYEPKALLIWMWSVAWEQTPCGSFPNDEGLIAARLELPPKVWQKHRDILMRNWWLASDGRLYHDTIAARVLAMLDKRAGDAQRAANRRARMSESCDGPPEQQRASRVTNGELQGEFDTKHQALSTKQQAPEKTQKPARKRAAAAQLVSVDDMVAEGVDRQSATDWLVNRKAKDLPLTPTAWQQTKDEAAKVGMTVPDAIKTAAGNGWAGFKASWLTDPHGARAPPARGQSALEARNAAVVRELLKDPADATH